MFHFTYNTLRSAHFDGHDSAVRFVTPGERGCYWLDTILLLMLFKNVYTSCPSLLALPGPAVHRASPTQDVTSQGRVSCSCGTRCCSLNCCICSILLVCWDPSGSCICHLTCSLSLPASCYLWPQWNDSDHLLNVYKVSGIEPSILPILSHLILKTSQGSRGYYPPFYRKGN